MTPSSYYRHPSSDVPREVYVPDLLADIGRIEAFAKEHGVSLVVVDSLSGGHSLDENSSEVRAVLAALSRLAASLGVAVIVVHHARKKGALESPRMTLDRVRGSSAISQFARSVFGLWKPVPDREAVRADCLKSNFAKPFAPLGFEVSDDGVAFIEPPEEPREPTAVDKAAEFLRVQLRKGPQKFSDLLERAEPRELAKIPFTAPKKSLVWCPLTANGGCLPRGVTHRKWEFGNVGTWERWDFGNVGKMGILGMLGIWEFFPIPVA